MPRIFNLRPYPNNARTQLDYVIITPEEIDEQKVTAAWSYAVRYTAKGIDLPDHEEAIKLLLERHPSWALVETKVVTVGVNLATADQDQPESE